MKSRIIGVLLFVFSLSNISQAQPRDMHALFLKYLEIEKVDSIYNAFLKVGPDDNKYEQALLFRNHYGWALNKTEQLKKDIPAIIKLSGHTHQMAYERIFRPQRFPETEWKRFYALATELEIAFDKNSNEYRELLGIKTKLQFLTRNDSAFLIDVPKLLMLLDTNGKQYSALLLHYGGALGRAGRKKEAMDIIKKGSSKNPQYLWSQIAIYTKNKNYKEILKNKDKILADSHGILLYDLGVAYLETGKPKEASNYFKLFVAKFEYKSYEPVVRIEYNNTVHRIDGEKLDKLGDFYFSQNRALSCKLYNDAIKSFNAPQNNHFLEKQISATEDKSKKKEMRQQLIDREKERVKQLKKTKKKVKKCP